jgi:hypothetical protein
MFQIIHEIGHLILRIVDNPFVATPTNIMKIESGYFFEYCIFGCYKYNICIWEDQCVQDDIIHKTKTWNEMPKLYKSFTKYETDFKWRRKAHFTESGLEKEILEYYKE